MYNDEQQVQARKKARKGTHVLPGLDQTLSSLSSNAETTEDSYGASYTSTGGSSIASSFWG